MLVKSLRSSGDGVVPSSGCRVGRRVGGRAILRRSDEFDSATLDDDVGGWREILGVTDRIVVAEEARLLAVQGVDLSATAGNEGCEVRSTDRRALAPRELRPIDGVAGR